MVTFDAPYMLPLRFPELPVKLPFNYSSFYRGFSRSYFASIADCPD